MTKSVTRVGLATHPAQFDSAESQLHWGITILTCPHCGTGQETGEQLLVVRKSRTSARFWWINRHHRCVSRLLALRICWNSSSLRGIYLPVKALVWWKILATGCHSCHSSTNRNPHCIVCSLHPPTTRLMECTPPFHVALISILWRISKKASLLQLREILLPSSPLSERRRYCDDRHHAVTLCVCPPH